MIESGCLQHSLNGGAIVFGKNAELWRISTCDPSEVSERLQQESMKLEIKPLGYEDFKKSN